MDSISDEIHIGEKNIIIVFIVGGFPLISETFILKLNYRLVRFAICKK